MKPRPFRLLELAELAALVLAGTLLRAWLRRFDPLRGHRAGRRR